MTLKSRPGGEPELGDHLIKGSATLEGSFDLCTPRVRADSAWAAHCALPLFRFVSIPSGATQVGRQQGVHCGDLRTHAAHLGLDVIRIVAESICRLETFEDPPDKLEPVHSERHWVQPLSFCYLLKAFPITAALAGKVTADPNGQVRTDRYAAASITGAKFADPRRSQFLAALEASGAGRVAQVRDAVPSDIGNAINIPWNSPALVTASGPLAQHVKTTLSLTDAQLNAIIADALNRPE